MVHQHRNGAMPVGAALSLIVIFGLLLMMMLFSPITFVSAGHVGVITLFGRVNGRVLREGANLIDPLAQVHQMTVRTQEVKETAQVPSQEGLILRLETSLLFRLDPARAAEVYQTVGPDYEQVVIEPSLRSAIRAATASNSASALYTASRELVAREIEADLVKSLKGRGIIVEAVLLRDIQPPDALKNAIEAKQQAEQDALRMQFVLDKEKREAERKRIEAQGIADFQRIVTQGISEPLLQWKGIEATEKLAPSPNTKVIVIGAGKSGLPLILGQ